MMPVGSLMIEHRLIERMIAILDQEAGSVGAPEKIDLSLVEQGVDFLRTYADRCHHGKEEDYLFKALENKPLSEEHLKILNELKEEHSIARASVRAIAAAREKILQGDKGGYQEISDLIGKLAVLYPAHIEKEDKHFFIPIMAYFSVEEQKKMLEDFARFDQNLIHEKYTSLVEKWENAPKSQKDNHAEAVKDSSIYECSVCGYRYDPAEGDPEHGIPAGTSFDELPEDWVCPLCGSTKDLFNKVG
jgi:hemerythrin-like domain-containing protein/rubredoxin